jgi:tetratricopeptide (TPR) repeat protein
MTTLPQSPPASASTGARPKALLTDLAVTPVSETIRQLAADGRSGDLLVRSGKLAKMVFFDGGRIVFAASNARKDRFGEALTRMGVISSAQFAQASALMKETKVRFGDALIAANILDGEGVARAVALWAESIVVSLFDLNTGSAFFEERECVIPGGYTVELSVDRILHAGIRTMSDHEQVLAGLGNIDRLVVATDVPEFVKGAEATDILARAKQPLPLRSLAWTAEGSLSPSRLRTAYALLAAGTLVEPSAESPAVKPAAAPVVESSSVRSEVEEELARSQQLDPKTWLDISMSAPRDKIVHALEQRMARYQALRAHVATDGELDTDIELLMGRASSTLRLTRRALAAKQQSEQDAAAPEPPTAPPPPAPAAAPPVSEAVPEAPQKPSMEIEHLRMEGDVRMSVSDFANAAVSYAALVKLQPDVADHHVRLAVAMARTPSKARQAEAHFLEAIRLEPKTAEYHYKLGVYYKMMKVHSRCITELRTALQLNPRHKKARAELEALSPKDSGLASLKRLLQ